jgi:hypothetical protein
MDLLASLLGVHTGAWYSDVVIYACWLGIFLGVPWILWQSYKEAQNVDSKDS